MNIPLVIEKLKQLGYKRHTDDDCDNTFYQWTASNCRIVIIFNYDGDTASGYVTFMDLIGNKDDLQTIKTAYVKLQEDLSTLSKLKITIIDSRQQK